MELHCPNCLESVETSGAPGEARCPKCNAPLVELSHAPTEPEGPDLLDDVLRDVRKIVHKETRAAKVQPPEPEAPGVFPKAPRAARGHAGPKLHYSVLIALGAVLVLGVAYLAFFLIQRGIAQNRGQSIAIRATGILPEMRGSYDQARKARAAGDYPAAAKAYVAALDHAEKVETILKGIPTNLGGDAKGRLLDIQTEALKVIRESQEALETPEIKFGGMNLVEVDGQWVTVADRDRLNAERMRAEGRQLYDGEWLTEAEIHERKGEVLYAGKWITREEYAKLVAEGEAKPMMTPPAPEPSGTPRTGTAGFEVSSPSWTLDNFESQVLDWTNVNWTNANPAALSIVTKSGSKQLLVKTAQGNNDKCAIVRRLALDLRSRSKLTMDIFNATGEPVMIAIAIETNRFYESRWKSVALDLSKGLTFDLNTADFKCAPTWQHMQSINNLNATRWLYILIYRNRPGEIYIDNIQLLGGE